ncbi:MAG: response regulator [Desulfamplus sp.]|nr:response regulator [Desulfamplus sp.]
MTSNRKINVLIVDDSLVSREHIAHILESGQKMDITVIGSAGSGEEALAILKAKASKPDVITMDVCMPGLTGFETARRIMEENPVPIVIVTSISYIHSSQNKFKMMEAGALAILEKPPGTDHPDYLLKSRHMRETIRAMSEVKLVRRWHNDMHKKKSQSTHETSFPVNSEKKDIAHKIVAIGVSTGGPLVLQTILSLLPRNFGLPIVIVQHIAPGFLESMVAWLGETSNLPIHIPVHGQTVLHGHVYIAPDNFHMGITGQDIWTFKENKEISIKKIETTDENSQMFGENTRISNENSQMFGENTRISKTKPGFAIMLNQDKPEWGSRPSVSYLFRSVLKIFGAESVGVILTGMGQDGTDELLKMKQAGAITIAQSKESCVIFGMPGEAVKNGAATCVLSPVEIAHKLIAISQNQRF